MKAEDQKLLLRALDVALSAPEQARFDALLAQAPEARAAWRAHRSVRAAVAAEAATSFGPHFADRVMQRLAHEQRARRHETVWTRLAARIASSTASWATPVRPAFAGLAVALVVAAVGVALWMRPQTYRVPYGERATLTLPDRSVVELGSGSTLTYRRPWGLSERHVRLEGEAFFAVVKDEAPFRVETFNAVVEVKGTRFNVRAWPRERARETSVALETGRVAVAALGATAEPVVLAPGEATVVAADTTAPRRPAPAVLRRVTAWRSGGLAFSDAPLSSVLLELERRYAVRIRLADPALAHRRVTYLDPQPPSVDTVLAAICVATDARYRRLADGFEVVPQ